MSKNSFGARTTLSAGSGSYTIYSLEALTRRGFDLSRLPYSIKILLENVLRREDGENVTTAHIEALAQWDKDRGRGDREFSFMPARVLLQDFTGVPVVADLAAMREAIRKLGGDATKINPLQPADLVIDHSVQVDSFGAANSFAVNAQMEFERNQERYQFLRWGSARSIISVWFHPIPESSIRSISNTSRRSSSLRRKAKPIPIRFSAPIRIPR